MLQCECVENIYLKKNRNLQNNKVYSLKNGKQNGRVFR